MKERVRQLIEYYGLNPYSMSVKISVSEGTIRKFLAGKIGMKVETLTKILVIFDEISPDWLLLGKGEMLRENCPKAPTKPYSTEENGTPMAAEQPEPYRSTPAHHTSTTEAGCPWERYDAAREEIGSLRERLARASATIATLQQKLSTERGKTPSPSAPTDTVVTLV